MVLYVTMNGKTDIYGWYEPFALMYRRANGTSYESIIILCALRDLCGETGPEYA
jgi:hypothetical protein